ncbi:MAG TPA: peptidoglycan DD-metalloendopeptidase family protein [Bacteroidales bacterium]|nr:peptidoglycan DD-metalloendopeptidase family protein [Bacteroidales bacterium]
MLKRIIISLVILLILVAAAAVYFYSGNATHFTEADMTVTADTISPEPIVMREYGIPVDSFNIIHGKVQRNQNLSTILGKYGVSAYLIDQIARKSKGVFDVRRIRPGNSYTVFLSQDTSKVMSYFVYEDTPVDYVLVDMRDSVNVTMNHKNIITRVRTASGKIKTSLWDAMVNNDINPMVALDLSDIYAWTVDFFALQPGDSFQVIYNEQYVDSTLIGVSGIDAAYFYHEGQSIYAIPFVQDSTRSFFDAEGNSLKKAFLKAPLRFSRISSRFSNSRYHPILKIRRPHHGVDYAAPTGTPVHAIGDGKVIKKGYYGGGGNAIKIRHNSVYTTSYMHLSRYAKGIHAGVYVKQGQLIGYVGSTGLATGPHLDFRVYKYGKAINPLKMKAPPVDPVHKENLKAYDSVRAYWMARLDSIPTEGGKPSAISKENIAHK